MYWKMMYKAMRH